MSSYAITRVLPRSSARVTAGETLAGVLVALVAAAVTSYATSNGTLKGVAVVIVVAGSLWFATTRRTAMALALAMVYLGGLDGYIKLASGSNLATFVRDLLLWSIVVGVLVRAAVQGKRLTLPPLSAWVIAFAVLVLVQIANPADGTLYHSLAGIRQQLEFVPLFFLTFTFVRTTKALRVFVILLVALATANGVVDYAQFHMTPQQLAAWGPGYSQRVLGTGGGFQLAARNFYGASGQQLTRPFGLMSDAGSGGLVCAISLGAILALGSMPGRRRYLPLAAIAAVAAVAGIITSQGRAVVVTSVVILLVYAILTLTSRRALATLLGVAAVAAVTFVTLQIINSSQTAVFRYKGVTTSQILSTTEQARGKSFAAIPRNLVDYPLGDGLGIGGPATGASGAPPQAGNRDAETEISFATLETGIPGMLVLIGFTIALLAIGLARGRREPDPQARAMLAAVIAPIAGILALYSVSAVTPTTPCGPYLWAAGGIIAYWLIARPAERRREADRALASG